VGISVALRNACLWSASAAFTIAAVVPGARAEPPALPMQYVIISFDGAQPIEQWQRSRGLAARIGATFTYFLSCVYLLSSEHKRNYQAPGHAPAKSNVGFAASTEDVAARLQQIWLAHGEGHDIASHACGHFDGADWSRGDWDTEFKSFRSIVENAYAINGINGEPAGWRQFVDNDIKGFRAPYLSTGKALYQALVDSGYDASGISREPARPQQDGGVVRFALPQIPEGPSGRRIIAMDYNMFVRHSGGFEREDKDAAFENRALNAFENAFNAEYQGKRTPLQLGFHFTLMNGGAYWRALERFATDVCQKPGVACVSYRDYIARNAPPNPAAAAGVGG
jgi:peptidoglycan/xylan/chitin deacetylase (PgdA/CDA1 family)